MAKRKAYAKIQCQGCKNITYHTHKSKKIEVKLELKKFCKYCRKHTPHKETKK